MTDHSEPQLRGPFGHLFTPSPVPPSRPPDELTDRERQQQHVIDDLSMLTGRMAYGIRKGSANLPDLAERAIDYIKRKGLGNILRVMGEAPGAAATTAALSQAVPEAWREVMRELTWADHPHDEIPCDECGGDLKECPRDCGIRRGRELLAALAAAGQNGRST